MTYLKALEISEQMWEWLCDNPDKDKGWWKHHYKYFKSDINDCLICMYRDDLYQEFSDHQSICVAFEEGEIEDCFLSGDGLCGRFYEDWSRCHNTETRRKFAEKIYFAILDERLKNM